MSSNIFVVTVDSSLATRMQNDLIEQGFEITIPQYTHFAARKKGISCTFYKSGKLTVQGKEMQQFIEFYLEPEILKTFSFTHKEVVSPLHEVNSTARIGIDESGKGDFFGPLCIAGVFAEGEAIARLKSLGVKDSKTLTESAILTLGKKIRADYVHHIVRINPAKYNELYAQFRNLNTLLAWGHATTIEQLVIKSNCHQVIIDQFAAEHVVITALKRKKLDVTLTQRHRAEEDLVVAAASILARCAFLEGLQRLGEEWKMDFPKGASAATIKAGVRFVNKHGKEALGMVGKLHFKTLDAILTAHSQ